MAEGSVDEREDNGIRGTSVMLPGAPPFAEAETVVKARGLAARLALSDLPILVSGEIGTGRRTLALAVAQRRALGKHRVVVASAFDGVPDAVREHREGVLVVVLHHVHALDARKQNELAQLVTHRRLLLVATCHGEPGSLQPELGHLLDATRVSLPPLRDREGDAIRWAELFLAGAATDLGCPTPTLSSEARGVIAEHTWPGNLSELESAVRRAVVLRQADQVEAADLGFGEKLVIRPLNDAVEAFRAAYVARVLAHFDGNRTRAAKALGIDPRTVFRYLAKTRD